jgi:hypothetical protein
MKLGQIDRRDAGGEENFRIALNRARPNGYLTGNH